MRSSLATSASTSLPRSVLRGAHAGDKDLRGAYLAGRHVDDGGGVAAVVDEQLLAGAVHLTHRARKATSVPVIALAVLAIPVGSLTVRGAVLLPQELQRHAFALELLMHVGIVRHRVLLTGRVLTKQQALQLPFVKIRR